MKLCTRRRSAKAVRQRRKWAEFLLIKAKFTLNECRKREVIQNAYREVLRLKRERKAIVQEAIDWPNGEF